MSTTQWRYLVVEVKTSLLGSYKVEQLQEELDRHGRLGWELVNVVHSTPSLPSPTLVFKRPA
ncbi:DUF4177 domain-containing protein [Pseudoxanthomonas sp. SGNA-20]|jgi:hypothetical protein|uniref:Uncharacterized protein DUF4177 n=1 Tax=Pseudoxanthomonas taiwanensis J19 TaxID=935569 RepID=A0A562D8I7_9GAMM|nr:MULTISPECIES: DUF4177 domain-containing protein [Pseudoxanthomonas]RRN55800.1 DUF4177 domain-containing protein [Pseudoxanthomonas sp. SGNA-20]RRN79076.1 DUF4177 domain-containing protein [Pseudoxanthomonas sp. SGD-10]TWH06013.1 uncharacterized protein DUF4177 [Pseudoxanthomonas taiwanensis J19]